MTRSRDVANIDGILTTTGDMYYASAASTPTRRAIGSTGQVLTVAGGVPTWATPSGGAKSLSLIGSGTLSGSSLTVSSLSTYDEIVVQMYGLNVSSAGQLLCRINNSSAASYNFSGPLAQMGSNTYLHWQDGGTSIGSYDNLKAGASNQNFTFRFWNCSSASGFTNFDTQGAQIQNATSANLNYRYQGTFDVAAAVSSLVFTCAGTFSGGTYRIYGA